jgi:hypothetical protein
MSKQDLTVAGFTIGQATLHDVIHRFPGIENFRLTKEEEAPLGVCIKSKDDVAVVFASGSPGGWDVLDTIYVARARSLEQQGAKCALRELSPNELATGSGIRIGASARDIQRLLPHSVIRDSTLQLNFSTSPEKAPWVVQTKPPESDGWVALSGAIGGFQSGRLRWVILYGEVTN